MFKIVGLLFLCLKECLAEYKILGTYFACVSCRCCSLTVEKSDAPVSFSFHCKFLSGWGKNLSLSLKSNKLPKINIMLTILYQILCCMVCCFNMQIQLFSVFNYNLKYSVSLLSSSLEIPLMQILGLFCLIYIFIFYSFLVFLFDIYHLQPLLYFSWCINFLGLL